SCNAVIKHQAAGAQQSASDAEIERQILQSHVLEHSDAGDLVEDPAAIALTVAREIAVIAQLDRAATVQTGKLNAPLCRTGLLAAERYAVRPCAVLLRRMHGQAAPTAANVEEALAGLNPQLAAYQVELLLLRLVERLLPALEIGAGVRQSFSQPKGKELGRLIVVIGDRGPIAAAGTDSAKPGKLAETKCH